MPKGVNPKNVPRKQTIIETRKKRGRPSLSKNKAPPPQQPLGAGLGFDRFNGLTGDFETRGDLSDDATSNTSYGNFETASICSGTEIQSNASGSTSNSVKNTNYIARGGKGKIKGRKGDLKAGLRGDGDLEFVETSSTNAELDEWVSEFNGTCEDDGVLNGSDSFDKKCLVCEEYPDIPDEVFTEDNPELVLPPSSTDLLIQLELLIPALEVYEVLRRFHQQLRLTPFKFEDFCAVLQMRENTTLLSEIHISLMKIIIKSEEAFGYQFTPADCKSTFDLVTFSMDEATWPVVVSDYILSLEQCAQSAFEAVTSPNYPFVGVAYRLSVLKVLTDIFVDLDLVRSELNSEGEICYDVKCRRCGQGGNLLCCDNCPAVYHLMCIKPPLENIPEQQWLCPLCEANQLPGVNETNLGDDSTDDLCSLLCLRVECLGYDRHLRRYWFAARRLIVEKRGFVRYYSHIEQVKYIIESLDAVCLEETLHAKLVQLVPQMTPLMAVTSDLTQSLEDALLEKYSGEGGSERVRMVMNEDLNEFELFITAQSKVFSSGERSSTVYMEDISPEMDSTFNGESLESDAIDEKTSILDSIDCEHYNKENLIAKNESDGLFCLGMDESLRHYVNFFRNSDLSMNKQQVKEVEERKRFLGYKFSMQTELKWSSQLTGSEDQIAMSLKQTLKQMLDQIPSIFMIDVWYQNYPRGVNSIVGYHPKPSEIVHALLAMQRCMKPCLFLPVWRESCSQMGFWVKFLQPKRESDGSSATSSSVSSSLISAVKDASNLSFNHSYLTSTQPDTFRNLTECISDDYSTALSDAGLDSPVFVSIPLKHNLYKTRGELYRQKGHGWIWLKRKRKASKPHCDPVKLESRESFQLVPQEVKKEPSDIKIQRPEKMESLINVSKLLREKSDCSERKRQTQLKHLLDVRLQQLDSISTKADSVCVKSEKSSISSELERCNRNVAELEKTICSLSLKKNTLENELSRLSQFDVSLQCYSCKAIKSEADKLGVPYSCYSPLCKERRQSEQTLHRICGKSTYIEASMSLNEITAEISSTQLCLEKLADDKKKIELTTKLQSESLSNCTVEVHKLKVDSKIIRSNDSDNSQKLSRLDSNIFSLPRYALNALSKYPFWEIPNLTPDLFARKNPTGPTFWPYFAERPSTKYTWESRVAEESSSLEEENGSNLTKDLKRTDEDGHSCRMPCALSTIAMLIKVLHASIRWEEVKELQKSNIPTDVAVSFLNKGFAYRCEVENGSAIIKDPQNVRDVPPLCLETEFLLRVVQLPNDSGGSAMVKNSLKDTPSASQPKWSPSKKSSRLRRSARTPKFKQDLLSNSERSVDVRWVSELELQLWEVKYLLERKGDILTKYKVQKLRREQEAKSKTLQTASGANSTLGRTQNAVKRKDGNKFGVWSDSDEESPVTTPVKSSPSSSGVVSEMEIKGVSSQSAATLGSPLKNGARIFVVKVSDGTTKNLVLQPAMQSSMSNGVSMKTVHVVPSSSGNASSATPRAVRIIPVQATTSSSSSTLIPTHPNVRVIRHATPSQSGTTPLSMSSPVVLRNPEVLPPGSNRKAIVAHVASSQHYLPNKDIARDVVSRILGNEDHSLNEASPKIQSYRRIEQPKFSVSSPSDVSRPQEKRIVKKLYADCSSVSSMGAKFSSEKDKSSYLSLRKRLSMHCSEKANRDYKRQVERKRLLMKEQINFELMFDRNRCALTREIYELPYTSVIQRQLLPEDDNDPNISFASSSESENDSFIDPMQSKGSSKSSEIPSANLAKRGTSNISGSKKQMSSNLISTGKRSAIMSKQVNQKGPKVTGKSYGGKRKLIERDVDDVKYVLKRPEKLDEETAKRIFKNRKEVFQQISANTNQPDELTSELKSYAGKFEGQGSKKRAKLESVESGKDRKGEGKSPVKGKGSQLKFGDKDTLHCVCKTPYDHTKFYLKCDLCLNWFHGKCVGVDGRAARKLTEFFCPDCQENCNKDELYCICHTPYDDSQFYIGCDQCGNWFHGVCVGVEPEEANDMQTYFCPQCKAEEKVVAAAEKSLNFDLESEHFELLLELMNVLMQHTHSWPFNSPSTDQEYPNYSQIISQPICFKDIVKRLQLRKYKLFSEFNADLNKVFENARTYHTKESGEFQCCDIVEKELVTFLTSFRQSIAAQNEEEEISESENSSA